MDQDSVADDSSLGVCIDSVLKKSTFTKKKNRTITTLAKRCYRISEIIGTLTMPCFQKQPAIYSMMLDIGRR